MLHCAQIAYEVATTHGLRRVLFGGFFIRANAFTMETITFALDFWSKVGARKNNQNHTHAERRCMQPAVPAMGWAHAPWFAVHAAMRLPCPDADRRALQDLGDLQRCVRTWESGS